VLVVGLLDGKQPGEGIGIGIDGDGLSREDTDLLQDDLLQAIVDRPELLDLIEVAVWLIAIFT